MSVLTMPTNIQNINSKNKSFFLFFIIAASLIPIGGSIGSIKRLVLSELLIPFCFLITLFYIAKYKNIHLFLGKRKNLLPLFLFIFMFVLMLNYIRNPLLPSSMVASESAGGFKTYYRFLSGFIVFFTITYWVNHKQITTEKAIYYLFVISLIIVSLALFVKYTGISIPGLGTFKWSANTINNIGDNAGAIRLPVLEVFGQICFLICLSGTVIKKRRYQIFFISSSLFCVVAGGGRVGLLTTAGAFLIWLFLKRHFILFFIIFLCFAIGIGSIQILHESLDNPQLKRLTDLGSLENSSVGRYYIFKYGLADFLKNPLFGTGYGKSVDVRYVKIRDDYESADFLKKQLKMGGHSTHIAILKNTGITGYLPFLLIWIYPIFVLLPVALRRNSRNHKIQINSSTFIVMLCSVHFVRMFVEGNGSELNHYVYSAFSSLIIDNVRSL